MMRFSTLLVVSKMQINEKDGQKQMLVMMPSINYHQLRNNLVSLPELETSIHYDSGDHVLENK